MLTLVHDVISHQVLGSGIQPYFALGPDNENRDPKTASSCDPSGHGSPEQSVSVRTRAVCYPWGIDPNQGIAPLHQPIIGQLSGPKMKRAGIQSAAFHTLLSKRLLGL